VKRKMKNKLLHEVIAIVAILTITILNIPTMVKADGQAGTTLSADVTATAYWTRTFSWTIEKSVEPDYWELHPDESGTSTYTITVTKDGYTDAYFINGTVYVTNGGSVATENLAITIELLANIPKKTSGFVSITTASVDVSSNPVLDPGETGAYPYTITIPSGYVHPGGTYKITANVTITNHSGYLNEPFGPSPSATTTLPSSPTLINDMIHVDDTNGYSWTFSSSDSVTYTKTFTCADEGENVNTATIRETGQSASATVTVTRITPPSATISGVEYYDANLNGERDPGEVAIAGWEIELYMWDGDAKEWVYVATAYTGTSGDYSFTVTQAGTYKVVEVMPSGMWVPTAPGTGYYEITVELGQTYTDNDFGNVCLMFGTGGKTLGFWSNKNGQTLITPGDVTALNQLNLYEPDGWTHPLFSSDLTTARTQIKNYLLNATAKDMRWMLSAQLIATKLNVLHDFLSGSTIVYVGPSTYVPSGFISIDDIMENANTALSGTDRAGQEYWKNLLDGVNNNMFPFVCPEPCYPIVYQ
jgi:hypothetical protein